MTKRRRRLEIFLGNIEKNAALIRASGDALSLGGSLGGRAAVVAGAGPGVERNCAELADRGRIVLYACDRARDRLMALGARPDFVVTTDPHESTASFIRAPGVEEQTLLASTYSSPEILALPWKKILFYNTTDADDYFNRRAAVLAPGAGFIEGAIIVSNFAYQLAERISGGPVAFAGVDLCAPAPEPEWFDNEDYVCVTLADGSELRTLKSFLLSLDWLDTRLAAAQSSGAARETFNCTEGGIMTTPRIPAMPLRDFIDKYRDVC